MIRFNLFEKLKIIFSFGEKTESCQGNGGNAGEVFIAARKIQGNGHITADGGEGKIGGKGGKITLISEDNQFTGEISAKGGKSTI